MLGNQVRLIEGSPGPASGQEYRYEPALATLDTIRLAGVPWVVVTKSSGWPDRNPYGFPDSTSQSAFALV